MLASYDELRKVNVIPFCDERKDGKKVLLYLNWAKCMDLLHTHGAERVYFDVMRGENGSSLIKSDAVFKDSNDNTNSVYETRIKVTIDDREIEFQGPIMNGANPVKDNSMSQQRLWNCQTRLFVKAVAIHTGLGFDLWIKTEDEEQQIQRSTDMVHNIRNVRERVLENFTTLNRRGSSKAEIAEKLGMSEDELDMKFKMYGALASMENKLLELMKENDQR